MPECEYIERSFVVYLINWYGGMRTWTKDDVINELRNRIHLEPSADVTKVVRCKDCKYRHPDPDFASKKYCSLRNVNGGLFCEDNDFCSYGKRKDG
jgi:hypothetical protein